MSLRSWLRKTFYTDNGGDSSGQKPLELTLDELDRPKLFNCSSSRTT